MVMCLKSLGHLFLSFEFWNVTWDRDLSKLKLIENKPFMFGLLNYRYLEVLPFITDI